jgi:hypothetical protein
MADSVYDIFISYNHRDEAWVREFQCRLETGIRHPRTKRKLVFFRDTNLRAGLNWKTQLQDALLRSACVLAVLSEAYICSDYCRMEWEYMDVVDPAALRGRILPIRIDKHPLPPEFTRLRQYRDFSAARDFDSAEFERTFACLREDVRTILSVSNQRSESAQHQISMGIDLPSPMVGLFEVIADPRHKVIELFLNDLSLSVLKEHDSARVITDPS